jgi:hypothetical protein
MWGIMSKEFNDCLETEETLEGAKIIEDSAEALNDKNEPEPKQPRKS